MAQMEDESKPISVDSPPPAHAVSKQSALLKLYVHKYFEMTINLKLYAYSSFTTISKTAKFNIKVVFSLAPIRHKKISQFRPWNFYRHFR